MGLSKHAFNRLAIRQRIRSAIAIVNVSVRVEAEARKNRGGEVAGEWGLEAGYSLRRSLSL